ncbi:MAG: hypothetical protein Q7R94_01200 [bacterium]|nr:hypothetical protein [bacterium]
MRQTTKRFTSMIIGLIFLVVALVVYFEFIQPAYEDAQAIKAKIFSQQEFLDSKKETINQVQKLISSYQGQAQIEAAISAALPIGEDLAGAIAHLTGISENSSLVLQSISASVAAPPASNKPKGGEQANFQASLQKPIGSVNFHLKLTGSYENLKTFISFLETNIRIFDLKSLGVQAASQSQPAQGKALAQQDFFNYEIGVTAYYQTK